MQAMVIVAPMKVQRLVARRTLGYLMEVGDNLMSK
nr:MAG TPA: hypothetical protein [Bacteriophage sp.]DAS33193.1 MAG TPA: hypothetical protein [Caudoviricetes sp.]